MSLRKRVFYPLGRKAILFLIALFSVVLVIVGYTISIVGTENWTWWAVVWNFLWITGMVAYLLTEKLTLHEDKISFPKDVLSGLMYVDKIVDEIEFEKLFDGRPEFQAPQHDMSNIRYEAISLRDDLYSKSVDYQDLIEVSIRNKTNLQNRQYRSNNEVSCIEFLDSRGRSFRLFTKKYSKKQIIEIFEETKRRMGKSKS